MIDPGCKVFWQQKVMAKLVLPPPLSEQADTHWDTVLFSCEAPSVIVLLRRRKPGLPFCLIYIQFCNWCEAWGLHWGQLPHDLPASHAIKLPFLIIIIYCSLSSASKSGSYNNSGSAKANRRTPAPSCWGFGDTHNTVQTKNAEQMENGKYMFPLCPISYAIISTPLDSMKESILEIYISVSE